jgi:hypothetical protein
LRAAWKGTELDDPTETALVAYFAREQLRRYPIQLVMHVLVITGVLASLLLNISRGGNGLVFPYVVLLVVDAGAFGFALRNRSRLERRVERNERVVSDAR